MVDPIIDYRRMLRIRKLRLFEPGVEPDPADSSAWDDGHVLSNEEVERIARSLIEAAPLDDNPRREEAGDAASRSDGWRIAR